MNSKGSLCKQYARMWPREVFDNFDNLSARTDAETSAGLEILNKAGIYVLYRDDIPYYIGQAKKLRFRIFSHANKPNGRYYNS